jgi:uncharacterized repeat protein (TIGR01451 family)
MMKTQRSIRNTLWTGATITGLLLGTAVVVPAQQNRRQDESQRAQAQQSKLQLPGSESVIEIDADVPSEIRVGDQVDYQINVRNVSDNVALHDLKLKIQAQQGMTLEQVKLEQKQNQQRTGQQQGQQQQGQQQQRDQQQSQQNQSQQDQQNQNQQSQNRQNQNQQNQSQQNQSQEGQQGQQSDAQQQSRQQQDRSESGNQRRQAQQQRQQNRGQSGQQQSQQMSGDQQQRAEDGSHAVTIGKLMPGESRTISVSATVEQEGQAQACVIVTQFSPALCLTTEAVKPELELVKTAPERAGLCEPIEFEYWVKNTGTGDLDTFEITDELPQGLQTESGDGNLSFEVDGLKAGDTRKFVATLTATQGGEFSSRAVAKTSDGQTTRSSRVTTTVEEARLAVAIDGPRSTLVDEPATYQIRVTNQGNIQADNAQVVLHHPEIARFRGAGEFRETRNQVRPQSGQSQPTAASRNRSQQQSQQAQRQQRQSQDPQRQNQDAQQSGQQQQNQDAQQSAQQQQNQQRQQEQQQEQAQQQQADSQNQSRAQQQNRSSRTFDLGTLEPGQTKQMTLTLLPTEAKQIRATAVARYRCATGDRDWLQSQASTSTDVISIPALLLTVVDNEEQRDRAGEVTYTIGIRNQGTAPDQQIQISATLPEGLEFLEGSGETDVTADGQELTIAPLQELAPEKEARWQIKARAKTQDQQQVRFRVNLSSQALEQQVVAEEPTTILPTSRTSARPSEISN